MHTDYYVKFYGENDLSRGLHLKKIKMVLNAYDPEYQNWNINQIIELHNIKQYIDRKMCLVEWDEATFARFQKICGTFPRTIGQFFATIDGNSIDEHYIQLDSTYENDFWELIYKYKVYERIEKKVFATFLQNNKFSLCEILKQEKLVKYYGHEIAYYMKNANESAELLMDEFLSLSRSTSGKIYFPDELYPKDRSEILQYYVESENANPNYLYLLGNAQSIKELLPIEDRLRLSAKKKYAEYWRKHFQGNSGIKFSVEISFKSMTEKEKDESFRDNRYIGYYSKEWVKENLDYPTLLNNFIYLFGFTDKWFRCSFLSKLSQMSVIERMIGVKGKNDYIIGMHFLFQRMISCIQIHAYRNELEINGIQIEAIFQWFFETYLINEFQAKGFIYYAPSVHTTTVEKCKLLSSAIDGVLKQYRLFCEDGYVDRARFEISSEQTVFSELRSMIVKKYMYINSDELREEIDLLYSDQSPLIFTDKTKNKYHTFAQVILNEQMVTDDFIDYQKAYLELLIKRGSLETDQRGNLTLNLSRAFIFKELYENEVICPLYCGKYMTLLNELQTVGDIKIENTLFSKPECDYLNFMLNKSQFRNGFDLRNKYIHDSYSLDPSIQETDYLDLLKIMVFTIIKINEELCLRDEIKKS